MPLVLIVALLFAGPNHDPKPPPATTVLPAVSVSPGEATDDATVSTCAQVISGLPLTLAGLQLRRTVSNPPTSSVVAWGDPAIVLRCGVAKPKLLTPQLTIQYVGVNGVLILPDAQKDKTVFTVVDRSVYIDLTVPSSYRQPPLGPIADAIKKVLPTPVCVADEKVAVSKQCTRRK